MKNNIGKQSMNQWLSLHSSWTSGVGWLDRLERLPIHLWWWRVDSDPQGQGDGSGTNLILPLFKKWIWFSILSRVLIHTWSRMNCALCIFTMSFHLDIFDEVEMPLVVVIFSFAAPRHASPGASAGRGPILRRKHKRHQSTSLSWTSNDQT